MRNLSSVKHFQCRNDVNIMWNQVEKEKRFFGPHQVQVFELFDKVVRFQGGDLKVLSKIDKQLVYLSQMMQVVQFELDDLRIDHVVFTDKVRDDIFHVPEAERIFLLFF